MVSVIYCTRRVFVALNIKEQNITKINMSLVTDIYQLLFQYVVRLASLERNRTPLFRDTPGCSEINVCGLMLRE